MINTLTIDSTHCVSELCIYGQMYATDKSPYNTHGHRHPYTAIYNMLFAPYKNKEIKFAEVGVAGGASVLLWNKFFSAASFFFFDLDKNFLAHSESMVGQNNKFHVMNIACKESIIKGLDTVGGQLDILLDDSSHNIDDQRILLHTVLPYIKSGGMIIIEDISRDVNVKEYEDILGDIINEFSFTTFIIAEHAQRYSPGWNNDKLLVLIKK